MVKHRLPKVVWLLLVVTALSIVARASEYSRQATALGDTLRDKPWRIPAPAGSKSITARFVDRPPDSRELELVVSGSRERKTIRAGLGVGAELLWSPDGKAFGLTTSNQGANGIYKAYIYRISGADIKKINLTPAVENLFGHPVKCGWPEPPNVAVVAWGKSSNRILVAAEIVHHSVCDSFGTFKLYELSVPSLKLVRIYDQITAKKKFAALLGEELMQADDECIRNPRRCFVPSNHE